MDVPLSVVRVSLDAARVWRVFLCPCEQFSFHISMGLAGRPDGAAPMADA